MCEIPPINSSNKRTNLPLEILLLLYTVYLFMIIATALFQVEKLLSLIEIITNIIIEYLPSYQDMTFHQQLSSNSSPLAHLKR